MWKFALFVDKMNDRLGRILCYLVLFMMLTGVYEVGMRYFFNRPTIWVWEINGFLLCVLVALGGGFALLTNTHVKVDILYDRFSARAKAVIDLFSSSFMFLFLGVLLWQTAKLSLRSVGHMERSQTLFGPPVYPFKVILAIGILIFLLQAMSRFIRNLYIAVTGKELTTNGT